MLARKEAIHCKPHVPRTAEWINNQAAALSGKKRSPETRQKLSAMRRGDAPIDRICKHCSAPFTVPKPSRKAAFCSRECGYLARSGEQAKTWNPAMPTVECATCGTLFRSTNTTTPRVCCSMRCAGIKRMRSQKNKGTDIEFAMAAALSQAGILFIEQYVIPSVGVPDFYLPATNTVVFCDGDYWHNLPKHIAKDAEQNAKLIALGYTVRRFWGKDIKTSPNNCVSLLQSA